MSEKQLDKKTESEMTLRETVCQKVSVLSDSDLQVLLALEEGQSAKSQWMKKQDWPGSYYGKLPSLPDGLTFQRKLHDEWN